MHKEQEQSRDNSLFFSPRGKGQEQHAEIFHFQPFCQQNNKNTAYFFI